MALAEARTDENPLRTEKTNELEKQETEEELHEEGEGGE